MGTGTIRFMRWNIVFAIMIIAGMGGKSSASDVAFEAARFFPLNPETMFTYQTTAADGSTVFIQRHIGNATAPGGISTPVIPITESNATGVVLRVVYVMADNTRGVSMYGADNVESQCTERLSPPLLIPNTLKVGETKTQTVQVTVSGIGKDCLPAAQVTYTMTFEQVEAVTVPAGTFQNCAKLLVHENWQDANGKTLAEKKRHLFFAPGIGIVKEEEVGGHTSLELASVSGK